MSVRLSVCADSCPVHKFFGLTLAYHIGHIDVSWDDMYIRDPNTTLTFDLKVKFTGFLTYFRGWQKLFWFYIHAFITIRGCVAYIHDPDSTLTFDLNFLSSLLFALTLAYRFVFWPQLFLSFDIVILCLAHECINMVQCVVYISWPLYGLDLWPQ